MNCILMRGDDFVVKDDALDDSLDSLYDQTEKEMVSFEAVVFQRMDRRMLMEEAKKLAERQENRRQNSLLFLTLNQD